MSYRLMILGLAATIGGCAGTADPHAAAPPREAGTHSASVELVAAAMQAAGPLRLDQKEADKELQISVIDPDDARLRATLSAMQALIDIEVDPAAMDIVADPNQRPIRVWFVKGTAGIHTVYLVGHADGECCPLISGLVQDLVDQPSFADGWFSFGYGHVVASDATEEGRLDQLRKDIQSKSAAKACAGQVALETLDVTDPIATRSAALTALGTKAYVRAKELGRPLLIWNHFDDHPRIVPALVPHGAGLKPLEFTIAKSDLAFPPAVLSSLSTDGIGQGIAVVNAHIAELKRRAQATSLYVDFYGKGWVTNYRDAIMAPAVQAANGRIDASISAWEGQPAGAGGKSLMLGELRAAKATNATALRQIASLPLHATSDLKTRVKYTDVQPDTTMGAKIQSALAEATAALGRLQIMATKTASAQRPEPVLTDAFLRGWPASFSSAKAETEFDGWVKAKQKPVWSQVSANLAALGLRLGQGTAGAPAALTLSNVVYRVRESGNDMVVTPYFILAGQVVQVVDPDAGLVHYEATSADQNLYQPGSSAGGVP